MPSRSSTSCSNELDAQTEMTKERIVDDGTFALQVVAGRSRSRSELRESRTVMHLPHVPGTDAGTDTRNSKKSATAANAIGRGRGAGSR